MSDPSFDINYVANLARLDLTPAEQEELGGQLQEVLGYVDQLKEVNVDGVDATAHPIPLTNVMRDDELRDSLPHDQAMQNAPKELNGLFQVPKIVE
ncbi:MAG: Asp-tRNA(Asn)/Glu-tRNA(Gln) amidotransferase subunit GatC [Limisphaerales bacterium]